jgi:hypothetical protein
MDGIARLLSALTVSPTPNGLPLIDVRINTDFSTCKPGPKDMLDAWVAAATVREFVEGKGTEVGGGDGLGTIILPRPLPEPVIGEVLEWPV